MRHPSTFALVIVVATLTGLDGCASSPLAPVIEIEHSSTQAPLESSPVSAAVSESSGVVVRAVGDESTEAVALAPLELSASELAPAESQIDHMPVNPAVVALLNTATSHSNAGQHDAASASLERALQIEPQDAWLWHRLARIRMAQGSPEEAANLAARSNTFATNDRPLLADNWRLIAATRQQLGDASGARAANLRADEFVSTAD